MTKKDENYHLRMALIKRAVLKGKWDRRTALYNKVVKHGVKVEDYDAETVRSLIRTL